MPIASAGHDGEDVFGQQPEVGLITPRFVEVNETDNLTYTFGVKITSMGNHTEYDFAFYLVTEAAVETELGFYPRNVGDIGSAIAGLAISPFFTTTINGLIHEPPTPNIITTELNITEDTRYFFVVFVIDPQVTGQEYFDLFVSIALDDLFGDVENPLVPFIEDLGLPPTITLAGLGLLILLAPLIAVTMTNKTVGNEVLFPIILMGASVAIFLRFWPANIIVFLGLFCGYVLQNALVSRGVIAR